MSSLTIKGDIVSGAPDDAADNADRDTCTLQPRAMFDVPAADELFGYLNSNSRAPELFGELEIFNLTVTGSWEPRCRAFSVVAYQFS